MFFINCANLVVDSVMCGARCPMPGVLIEPMCAKLQPQLVFIAQATMQLSEVRHLQKLEAAKIHEPSADAADSDSQPTVHVFAITNPTSQLTSINQPTALESHAFSH